MPFYFPFLFFLLFHAFPFRFPWFLHCRLHIFMYIHSSTVSKSQNTVPTSFPASLALRTPRFRSHSTCAPRRNLPILSRLLRTRLTPFAPRHTPATAVVCLFWARPAVCQRINVICSTMAHNNDSEHRCIDRGTTGGGCIDHRAGRHIDNRAGILTEGRHIDRRQAY